MKARTLATLGLAVAIFLVTALVTAQPSVAGPRTGTHVTVRHQRVCYTVNDVRRCHIATVRLVHRGHR